MVLVYPHRLYHGDCGVVHARMLYHISVVLHYLQSTVIWGNHFTLNNGVTPDADTDLAPDHISA